FPLSFSPSLRFSCSILFHLLRSMSYLVLSFSLALRTHLQIGPPDMTLQVPLKMGQMNGTLPRILFQFCLFFEWLSRLCNYEDLLPNEMLNTGSICQCPLEMPLDRKYGKQPKQRLLSNNEF